MAKYNSVLSIAHRLKYYFLAFIQILIDIFICQLCFLIIPKPFSFEVRVFLTGSVISCLTFYGLYGFRNWTLWEETASALRAWLLAILFDVLFLYTSRVSLPVFRVTASVTLIIPLTLAARYYFRTILFRSGILSKSIIILGAGEAGQLFAGKITSSPFTIRRALCFLDDDETKHGTQISGLPVLGKLSDFGEVQKQIRADEAVIAIPTAARRELSEIFRNVEQNVERVLYVPDMYMLTVSSASISSFDGLPLISSSQGLKNHMNLIAKTIIDYIGAVIAIVLFSPFMIWAAYKIKKEDGGPIFFIQDRVGWKGRHFRTYKFRSMCTNADEVTKKLFSDPEIFAAYKKGIKLKDDPRLTKIGAFLRKTSIDELPQLFNVLRGEMSLVGPRPLMQSDVDMVYGEEFTKKVYAAKPGLTGIWQVSGRSDLDADFRREINCYYVHNWSVWLDIAILLKTPLAVVSHKGAY